MDLYLLIVLSLSVGMLSIQIAYASPIVENIKRLFGLTHQYKYKPLLNIKSWKRIIRSKIWFNCLFPFIAVFIFLLHLHQLVNSIFHCAFCLSFWLMLLVNTILINIDIPMAIVLAPTALVGVAVVEKIMK